MQTKHLAPFPGILRGGETSCGFAQFALTLSGDPSAPIQMTWDPDTPDAATAALIASLTETAPDELPPQ